MELFDTRFFEMLFLICFGISWPMNIVKAVRGKTSKGVSLWFLLVCFIGYVIWHIFTRPYFDNPTDEVCCLSNAR